MASLEIEFNGKNVLVTGGGGGIGRALCEKLTSLGAHVFALDKNPDGLELLKSSCPQATIINVDLENWNETRAAVGKLPAMHCLVNNAGIAAGRIFMETTSENFDKVMNVNCKAMLNVSQVVSAKMIENEIAGSIVNMSSVATRYGVEQSISYNLSKAAVDSLTQAMALDLGPKNIRVNAVNPSIVMTDLVRKFYTEGLGQGAYQKVVQRSPLGRVCQLEDVVNTVLVLLSPIVPMVHGSKVFIDGGFCAY